jgi:hypothetical protein
MFSYSGPICLACGAELPEALRWTASLRCHDCRELNAALRVEHTHGERGLRLRSSIRDRAEPDGARLQPLPEAA